MIHQLLSIKLSIYCWYLRNCSLCLLRMLSVRVSASVVMVLFNITLGSPVHIDDVCGADGSNYCLLRETYYPKELWNHFAGNQCYAYTNPARLKFKYGYTTNSFVCRSKTWKVPVAIVDGNNHQISYFDYMNDSAMHILLKSFKSDAFFDNFLTCCEEAAYCCQEAMNKTNILPGEDHCPAVWDAWSCYPPTKVNSTARQRCSSQAFQSPENVCALESEKYCIWDSKDHIAKWIEQTNYNKCTVASMYKTRHTFHVIALGTCIVLCIPAISIFLIFPNLRRIRRVALHRNLLIAVCVRNFLTIISKTIVILDALKSPKESNHVMDTNSVECRILAFFENSAKNCIYASMLLDGWHLHKEIVRPFAKDIQNIYLYITLAGLTLIPSLIWAAAMGIRDIENCWMAESDGLQWIVDGYRIFVLVTNTFLLLDIIRVMCMKLNQGGSDRKTRLAFRATLFLIPLFGVHIMITAKKITYDDSCTAEDIYDYSRYAMEALQGIWVAILFCYINSEVLDEIRNGYRKLTISLDQRFGWNLRRETRNNRRSTTATYVQPAEEYKPK